MISQTDRVFIPISLGNHYYSGKVLEYIRDNVLPNCEKSHVLICDRLRVLIYKMRYFGQHIDLNKKVNSEVEQFIKTLNNSGISKKNTSITTWKFASQSEDYQHIYSSIKDHVYSSPSTKQFLETISSRLLLRFVSKPPNEDIIAIQEQYLMEETAISIYMTEIYGTNTELYRKEGNGLVDVLYREHSAWLARILNKSVLERRFVSLEKLI